MNVHRFVIAVSALAAAGLAGCNSRPEAEPALHAAVSTSSAQATVIGFGIRPSTGASGIQP